jgi:hypothetical protein
MSFDEWLFMVADLCFRPERRNNDKYVCFRVFAFQKTRKHEMTETSHHSYLMSVKLYDSAIFCYLMLLKSLNRA